LSTPAAALRLLPIFAYCLSDFAPRPQSPHSGSVIAHDLANTSLQRSVALLALEKLLHGSKDALLDLTYDARKAFVRRHPYPASRVATLCVACSESRPTSLLRPTIDYAALRYGEPSDGCVCQVDATLPGCPFVHIDDMDHFGPAWKGFPATDGYDPTKVWLVCTSIALCG